MNDRFVRYGSWAAYAGGIIAMLSLVTLMLFYALEAPQASAQAGQGFQLWGTLNDVTGVIEMLPLLVVAFALLQLERVRAPRLSLMAGAIGALGMIGVAVLQLLLIMKVMPFDQEVGPVLAFNGLIGVWLILVNYLGRLQAVLPARLAWLGIAVGAAFVLVPLASLALGAGSVVFQNAAVNDLALTASAIVFLLSFVGFPIWAIWLGHFLASSKQEAIFVPDSRRTQT